MLSSSGGLGLSKVLVPKENTVMLFLTYCCVFLDYKNKTLCLGRNHDPSPGTMCFMLFGGALGGMDSKGLKQQFFISKSKVDNILGKVVTLRINLNIDVAPSCLLEGSNPFAPNYIYSNISFKM